MRSSWTAEFLASTGVADPRVMDLVEKLVSSTDSESAGRAASLIEMAVAPPSGGVSFDIDGVVTALLAALPVMDDSVRWHGLALLNQIAGSVLHLGAAADQNVVRAIVGALPSIAGFAQRGDSDMQGEFVDFCHLCRTLDESVSEQVASYLERLVEEVGGAVGESAQTELGELAKLNLQGRSDDEI